MLIKNDIIFIDEYVCIIINDDDMRVLFKTTKLEYILIYSYIIYNIWFSSYINLTQLSH